MTKPTKAVIFSHGLESGPTGNKINYLSGIAKEAGYLTFSVDYRGIDSPTQRVEKLLQFSDTKYDTLVLVGSSMGGYVSTVASSTLKPQGLFLLAPALNIGHYPLQNPMPHSKKTLIVHGWQDAVIPVEDSIQYAKNHTIPLHILVSNHRLENVLPEIGDLFRQFLTNINNN